MRAGETSLSLDPIDERIAVRSQPEASLWTPALSGNVTFSLARVYPMVTLRHMNKDSGMRIRVERELREQFLAICRAKDRPAAQVLREFMRQYIEENRTLHPDPHQDNAPPLAAVDPLGRKAADG